MSKKTSPFHVWGQLSVRYFIAASAVVILICGICIRFDTSSIANLNDLLLNKLKFEEFEESIFFIFYIFFIFFIFYIFYSCFII